MAELEETRRRQSQQLLQVLEEEQRAEDERERALANAGSDAQRHRLEAQYRSERALASERIMRLMEEHETRLAARMRELGLAPGAARGH